LDDSRADEAKTDQWLIWLKQPLPFPSKSVSERFRPYVNRISQLKNKHAVHSLLQNGVPVYWRILRIGQRLFAGRLIMVQATVLATVLAMVLAEPA
jgi:hypothetical protein